LILAKSTSNPSVKKLYPTSAQKWTSYFGKRVISHLKFLDLSNLALSNLALWTWSLVKDLKIHPALCVQRHASPDTLPLEFQH
jgi:hypothetical protein